MRRSGFMRSGDMDVYRYLLRAASPRDLLQPETIVWRDRIIKNGGTISAADVVTTNTLMWNLNQASYRNKILYLMPFMGTVWKAWIVPLVDDPCYGIGRNTGTTPFGDSDGGTTIGFKGTGASGIVTAIQPGNLNGSLGGVGAYMRALNAGGTATEVVFASNISVASFDGRYGLDLRTSGTNNFFSFGAVGNRTTAGPALTANHHYYGQKSSNTLRSFWDNGAASGTNNTTNDTAPSTSQTTSSFGILITADAASNSYAYSQNTVGCVYFTDGTLASGDISALHTLLTTYLITPTGR